MRRASRASASERSVVELLSERVAATPNAIAVVRDARSLTYRELWEQSLAARRGLRRLGVKPGDTVGLAMERDIDAVLVVIAAVGMGACYATVEPGWPPRWIDATWASVKPTVVVRDLAMCGHVRTAGVEKLLHNACAPVTAFAPPHLDVPLAVVCTSGSTGHPRAVVIPHRALLNRIRWMADVFGFRRGDVAALHRSMSLVSFPAELFGPLLHGIPSVVIRTHETLEPNCLWQQLADHRVSILRETPASSEWLLRTAAMRRDTLPALRLVHIGGEVVTAALLQKWREAFPGVRLLHGYGCTEYSVIASCDVTAATTCERGVPLGVAAPNTTVYVMDRHLRPVPDGTIGEICVAGDGMAIGYRSPPATRDGFVANPSAPGERLFCTGDLGWRRTDGLLAFGARRDRQTKIRGFRVEPAAVEAALCALRGVRLAAAIPFRSKTRRVRLAGFVVGDNLDVGSIKRALLKRVPTHLVPHDIFALPALPLTTSGKVDAKALRAVARSATPPRHRIVRASLGVRRAALRILAKACQAVDVRPDCSFLESGGDSLAALTALLEIQRRLKVTLELSALLDGRPLSAIADAVERAVATHRSAGSGARYRSRSLRRTP